MPARKDVDRADEGAPQGERIAPAKVASRITGAQFLGGRWITADGSPLTDQEAQQAHRAMDAAAAEARRRAVLGVTE